MEVGAEVSVELVKKDVECKSGDTNLGTFNSMEECAEAVKLSGAKFFIYGKINAATHKKRA